MDTPSTHREVVRENFESPLGEPFSLMEDYRSALQVAQVDGVENPRSRAANGLKEDSLCPMPELAHMREAPPSTGNSQPRRGRLVPIPIALRDLGHNRPEPQGGRRVKTVEVLLDEAFDRETGSELPFGPMAQKKGHMVRHSSLNIEKKWS